MQLYVDIPLTQEWDILIQRDLRIPLESGPKRTGVVMQARGDSTPDVNRGIQNYRPLG